MIRLRLWLAYWFAGSPAGRVFYYRRRRWPLVAVLVAFCVARALRN